MVRVTHVREEVWDQHTKEFRLKSLPTVPDAELNYAGSEYSASPGAAVSMGSVVVPPGSVLRVTLLRYLTSDPRGAMFAIVQNGGTIDTLYLPSPGETLVIQPVDSPVYVLEGTVEAQLLPAFGSIYAGTYYGIVMHGYYSRQETLKNIT